MGGSISRRYLHDEVADRLRELIIAGEIAPKARVNELELSQRFGISRTPLREAIKILATEGLLELLPNRGARVASLSEAEIDEVIEVVAGLEATAADLACRRVTEKEIATIADLTDVMVRVWEREDEEAYFRLNRDIHEAIMRASRNATLEGIYANFNGRIQRARYTAHKTAEQWRKAIDEHKEMMVLLRAREPEALATLMRVHIRGKKPVIAAAFGEEGEEG